MLQLHLDLDMGALEVFVTLEVVEGAVIEVENEVVATREDASKVVGARGGGVRVKIGAFVGVPKVIEVEDTDKS